MCHSWTCWLAASPAASPAATASAAPAGTTASTNFSLLSTAGAPSTGIRAVRGFSAVKKAAMTSASHAA